MNIHSGRSQTLLLPSLAKTQNKFTVPAQSRILQFYQHYQILLSQLQYLLLLNGTFYCNFHFMLQWVLMFQSSTTANRPTTALTSQGYMVPILVQSKPETVTKVTIFWHVAPCSMVDTYQYYGGTRCLHLQEMRWNHQVLQNSGTYLPKQICNIF